MTQNGGYKASDQIGEAGSRMMRHSLPYCWVLLLLLGCSTSALAGQWGLKVRDASEGSGAEVTSVAPGMPAAKAGLKPSDIIVQAEGNTIASAKDFVRIVKAISPGKPLSIRISREGWEKALKLYPLKRKAQKPKAKRWLGMKVTDQPAGQGPGHGVRVASITPGGPAATAGLKAGDVITHSQGRKIKRAKDFVSLVKTLPSGKALSLNVVRDGWEKKITLAPGVKPETARVGKKDELVEKPFGPESKKQKAQKAGVKPKTPKVGEATALEPKVNPCAQGWLGVDVAASSGNRRAEIKKAISGQAAERAGFRPGDVIRSIDGKEIIDCKTLVENLQKTKPGQKVIFNIKRNGKTIALKVVMGRVPEDVCLLKRINQALACNDLSTAKTFATTLVQKFPDNAIGYSKLAYIFKMDGNLPAAKQSLKKAIELEPDNPGHKSNLGIIYTKENNFDEAEKYYKLALESNPGDQNTWGNLGALYRKQKRFSEAVEACQKALKLGPPLPWVLHNLAFCLYKQGKMSESIAWLEKATELAPDDPNLYFGMGDVYYNQKNWKKAEEYYKLALKRNPKVQLAWERLGNIHARRYMYPEAIAAYRKGLEAGSPNVVILKNLGIALRYQRDFPGARENFEKAIELNPKDAFAYHGLGWVYFDQKNWKQAEKYFKLAVKYDPKLVPAWMNLGDTYGHQDKHSKAIKAYQKALEVSSPDQRTFFGSRIFYGLGWNLYNKKKYAKAEDALREALKFNPGDPNTLLTLGTTMIKQKKTEQAQQYWQKAAELDPNGPIGQVARQNLAKTGYNSSLKGLTATPAGRADGLKATIAVGDFQVKAAIAGQFIGDGLREMFVTALHNSGYFVVLERIDIQGLVAEQALSRSSLASKGSAIPSGQMDAADIIIYGVVTEFEAQAHGIGMMMAMPNVPVSIGGSQKEAHMAIDIRVVDVATGKILTAQRIPGMAMSTEATLGASIPMGKFNMPMNFSMFRDTPMEKAIRDCIQKATFFIVNNIPEGCFCHK